MGTADYCPYEIENNSEEYLTEGSAGKHALYAIQRPKISIIMPETEGRRIGACIRRMHIGQLEGIGSPLSAPR